MKPKFRVKPMEIEANLIRLHPASNRELQQTRVKKLEREMDLDKLGRFAAWRDGRNLYILDGQHRKVALENLGMGDWKVRIDVYEGITFQDACDLFLGLNDGLAIHSFDKFDKAEKAGHEAQVETKKIIESKGIRVSRLPGDGKLACVAAAVDVWKLDRGLSLDRALDWITEAWGTDGAALEGHVLRGLGIVAFRYKGEIDDPAIAKKLAKMTGGPSSLQGRAKAQREIKGKTVGWNIAAIVVDVYNKGRRSGQIAPL